MAKERRPDAEQLLRMAEHRRSMRALERVSANAARLAETTAARHLQAVPADATDDEVAAPAENVVSLAAMRARRAGHPAGSNLRDRPDE